MPFSYLDSLISRVAYATIDLNIERIQYNWPPQDLSKRTSTLLTLFYSILQETLIVVNR